MQHASLICAGNLERRGDKPRRFFMADNLLTPALDVYEQMALDEVLVHASLQGPVLRFYHWKEGPAVTFGYAQFYQEVSKQCFAAAGPLCRRPTGGGVVFHGEDLTFSLVFESKWSRPKEIYAQLHSSIENILLQKASFFSSRQEAVDGQAYAPSHQGKAMGCFANPVEDDLLAGGRKILGGAIRRFGNKVLYQGSLQCEQARTKPIFRHCVAEAIGKALNVSFRINPVSSDILQQSKQLSEQQYRTKNWNQKF